MTNKLAFKLLLRMSMLPIVFGLLIMLPAGTWNYWQAYIYFFILIALMLGALVFSLRSDPQLLERCLQSRESEITQKLVVLGLAACVILGYIVFGLDKRLGWSEISLSIVLIADMAVVAGYLFILYVFSVNSFAARTIKVESDKVVISHGTYSVVRHPMYTGVIIMYLATPVARGSWWGLLPFILMLTMLVPRILNEELVLKRELKGYKEYCQCVKWRLLPQLW